MKSKIYNLLLILTSLVGYLEWGRKNHQFLFEAEAEIFTKQNSWSCTLPVYTTRYTVSDSRYTVEKIREP